MRLRWNLVVHRTRRFSLVAVTIGLTACNADNATRPRNDELFAAVRALGFDATTIRDRGSFVIVEGDIRIEKNDLVRDGRRVAPATPLRQYHTTALVSSSQVRQIKVSLANVTGISNWADAIRTAMAAYNATASEVYLVEGTPADITFSSVSSAEWIALASWPSGGEPGPTITINTSYNYDQHVVQRSGPESEGMGDGS